MSGALLGALLGVGLLTAVRFSPPLRRVRLDDRLAPYLRDAVRPSRLLAQTGTRTPFPTAERLLGPLLAELVAALERGLGGSASVRRRLAQAGLATSVEQFRVEQVVWGFGGLLGGAALAGALLAHGSTRTAPLVLLCGLSAVAGVFGRDRWLSRQVRTRADRMVAEFPAVAEMLALAVGAGESPVAALQRVAALSGGELSRELEAALADARAGAPLPVALDGVARRTALPLLARFVDGMVVALERGTPLADVLRAQAADVREAGRQALLESGGKREVAMLAPVVFLIMPTVLLFLCFPGFYGLSLTTP